MARRWGRHFIDGISQELIDLLKAPLQKKNVWEIVRFQPKIFTWFCSLSPGTFSKGLMQNQPCVHVCPAMASANFSLYKSTIRTSCLTRLSIMSLSLCMLACAAWVERENDTGKTQEARHWNHKSNERGYQIQRYDSCTKTRIMLCYVM